MFPTNPPPPPSADARGRRVEDLTNTPAGVLPRHVQTWVILGIAVLMTGIIALSGSSRPVDKKPAASPGAAALAASDARIQEYRARIDEEARRLSAAQADLDVAKQSLTAPVPATAPTPMPEPTIAAPLDTSVQRERAERAYRSLFADNVAFSLRKQTLANGSSVPVAAPPTPLAAGSSHPAAPATDAVLPMAAPVLPFGSSSSVTAPAVAAPTSAVETKARRYPLLEGTILEAVLTNRLDGTFAGPVNGMVTTAVYARDRQHLLIPQGARLLGEAKSVASFGQQRLAVAFHRLVMPDGATVTLDQFKGLSQVGETGLQDHVNHHYLQLFGVSLAIGAIGGLAQADTRVGLDATGADLSRQGLASSTAQSSLHILDRFLNVLPTVTIREGQRLKVYLSNDLELPAYGASHDE